MATNGAPTPGPPTNPLRRRPFLIGLGIGAVPLVLSLVAGGLLATNTGGTSGQAFGTGVTLGFSAGALYVVTLVTATVLLFVRSAREVALGMLAIVVTSPVISYIGCSVVLPYLLRPGQ